MRRRKKEGETVEREKLLSTPALRERGWTGSILNRFMPEPDKLKDNPHYKSGPQMRLHLQSRAEKIETTSEFEAAKNKAESRSRIGKEVAKKKKAELIVEVKDLPIRVKIVPNLTTRAISHYNKRLESDNFDGDLATSTSDEKFLNRIQVNYIRHRLTRYDFALKGMAGRIGTAAACIIIREKVYDAIADAYPGLKEECLRQKMDRRQRDGELGMCAE